MTLRAVISGYYGHGNTGDEAVLSGMLHALRPHGVEPVVISGDSAKTEALHGVRAIARGDWGQVARAIRRADLLISGGGGLIQDSTSRRSALYYLGIIGLAKAMGVPTYLYAQGVGPVRTRTVRAAARAVLPGVVGAGVRDEDSARALVRLGVPGDRVTVTADAAFALPPVTAEQAERAEEALHAAGISEVGENEVRIGLVWRPPASAGSRSTGGRVADRDEGLARAVASTVGTWAEEVNGRLIVLPMHPVYDMAQSEMVANQASLGGSRAVVINEPGDFRMVRSIISRLDILLSVRFHGLLFAVGAGVPCVGVAYDPKVRALAQAFGFEALPLTVEEDDVRKALSRAWARRDELRRTFLQMSDELRQRALEEGGRPLWIIKGARA